MISSPSPTTSGPLTAPAEKDAPIFAVDPGCTESAWVLYYPATGKLSGFGKERNEDVMTRVVRAHYMIPDAHLAIEMIASYGMPVGREVFETCVWIGRFIEAWQGMGHTLVYRRDVKLHLCNSVKAKDGNVRQALIDKFGGGKASAIGKKDSPGPLYGVSADVWAALGVAVTFADRAA